MTLGFSKRQWEHSSLMISCQKSCRYFIAARENLVSLAQATVTKFQRLEVGVGVTYKQQTFFPHSPGGWKSEIRKPAWLGSGVSPLPGCRLLTSHCILTGWRAEGRGKLSCDSYTGVNPLVRIHDLM